MKLPTTYLWGLTLCIIFFHSCKKDESESPITTSPSSNINTIQDYISAYSPQAQSFTINAQFPTTIRTEYGSLFNFSPNAFEDPNGNIVAGNVEIFITEYMTLSEMVLGNKPTLSNEQVLVSGGQFNVEAYQNDIQLQASNEYALEMFVPSNAPDPYMTLFTGNEDLDGTVDWQQENENTIGYTASDSAFYANCSYLVGSIMVLEGSNVVVTYNQGSEPLIEHGISINSSCGDFLYIDDVIASELINAEASTDCTINFYLSDSWSDGWQDASLTIQVGTQTLDISVPSEGCEPNAYNYVYHVVTDYLGYINLDYFWNNPNPTTTIYANYPSGFDCENTICFLIFPDILSVADMSCNTNENGEYMEGVPEGTDAHNCALSYDPETDIFYSAIVPITVSTELSTNLVFTETTAEEFEAYINGL